MSIPPFVVMAPNASPNITFVVNHNTYLSDVNGLIYTSIEADVIALTALGCQPVAPRSNLGATIPPTGSDDFTADYQVGSLWGVPNFSGAPALWALTSMTLTPGSAVWTQFISSGVGTNWPPSQQSYSGAATISNADSGKVIIVSGAGFYKLTFGAAAGYSAGAFYFLTNPTARGKGIIVTGGNYFILWPGQIVIVTNVNNIWQVERSRWRPYVAPTFYVDNVHGDDTSDGLDSSGTGAGCFLTVQHASNVCYTELDNRVTNAATIQLPLNTSGSPITENLNISGTLAYGQFDLLIIGDNSNPKNCQWYLPTGASGQPCIQIADYATVTLRGINFGVSSGNVPALVAGRQTCIIDLGFCAWSANPTQVAVKCLEGARANCIDTQQIINSMGIFFQIFAGGGVSGGGQNFDLQNTTANVGIFAECIGAGANFEFTGITFSNTALSGGTQYSIDGPSAIIQSGVSWPGTWVAGSVAHGGQVI